MQPEDVPARAWHAAAALVSGSALTSQLVDVLGARDASTAVVRFGSFFTVQSNLLLLAVSVLLVLDPRRDGRLFRVLRANALIGITCTAVVYNGVLNPGGGRDGLALTDALLHGVAPLLAVVGWAVFGPRPRVDRLTQVASLVWPALFLGWTLVHGAVSGWWPYAFLDADDLGLAGALRSALVVGVLLLGLTALLGLLDRRLPARAA